MGEFSWSDKEVVFPTMHGVAVYTNSDGDIVIRQEDPMRGDDSVILIPRGMARSVAKAIRDELAPTLRSVIRQASAK